jgi:uncharacterized protein
MINSYINAALQGKNEFWRYFVGLFLIVLFSMIIGAIPAGIVFEMSNDPDAAIEMDFETAGISPSVGLAVLLLPFAVGWIGVWIAVQAVHGRPLLSAIHPTNQINWKKVWVGAGIWLGLTLVLEGYNYLSAPNIYEWTFDAERFMPILVISLLLIPLQTSFEEIVFRGYLMQGLGILFRYPIVSLVLTSLLFGSLHFANPEMEEYGSWMIWTYILMGLMLGLVTLMDEGLELALGVHAANNLYASLFVTFPGSVLETPAMITMREFNAVQMSILATIAQVVFVIICAVIYKWDNFGKLFSRIVLRHPESV